MAPNQAQAQQAHMAYMQQFHQTQLRQQVAYMQQAMMAGAMPYPAMPGYPGAMPYMGGMPQAPGGKGADAGFAGKGGFVASKGKGFGYKGGFKGTGGKGKKGGFKGSSKGKGEGEDGVEGEEGADGEERAPRVRKDEPPIVKAQREARERAEGLILKQLQGRWVDQADADLKYKVEGNTCSVSNKNGGRVFHNRLSMYGVEFCWNAKRFWHDLNLKELQGQGEDEVEKVEWNPGKSSPPADQIVWVKDHSPPTPPPEPEEEAADVEGDAADAAPAADTSTKTEWPELVGQAGDAAEAAIRKERPDLAAVESLPEDAMVTMDFREDRVRVFVNADGTVARPPKIG